MKPPREQEREVISLDNKIYVLINIDCAEALCASYDRNELEAIMCDMFMEDFQGEMQQALDSHWINMENPDYESCVFKNDTWDCLIRYYKAYYDIQEVSIL